MGHGYFDFHNPPYMASRQLLIIRIPAAGTSFSPLPCQAGHGYTATNAHRVEVEVGADGPASAPPSGAAAAAPPAGARPNYMRMISGTGRGASALFFASHESSLKVPSDSYTMATHRVLGLTAERASHARKCPRCNEATSESRGSGSSSTVSGISMSGERSIYSMLMDHIPRCPCSWYIIQLHDVIVHVLEEFMLEAGATKGRDLQLEVRRIRSGASRDRPWPCGCGLIRLQGSTSPSCC
jgi:hypothetical protein